MHEFGTTREQLAQIALNARKNAALNPRAVYREPLTLDDYFGARLISTPFCLYDCDVPVDGATAFVLSRAERARDLRKPPLRVEAIGAALHGRPSWDQFDDLTTMALRDAGRQLWARTDLTPRDVDVAQETAKLTRAQVLQQAGISVLAQANVSAQNALALLRQ